MMCDNLIVPLLVFCTSTPIVGIVKRGVVVVGECAIVWTIVLWMRLWSKDWASGGASHQPPPFDGDVIQEINGSCLRNLLFP